MTIQEQVLSTWYENNGVNLDILETIPDETLKWTTSKRGGGTIGYQFTHIHNVRFWKLEASAKDLLLPNETSIKVETPLEKSNIRRLLLQSADQIAQFLQLGLDNSLMMKRKSDGGVINTLARMVAHEAHHRGNIMLTLKLQGYKIPDNLKWNIWDWNRYETPYSPKNDRK
jgi:uncharacterized damage-inducible protein DinB